MFNIHSKIEDVHEEGLMDEDQAKDKDVEQKPPENKEVRIRRCPYCGFLLVQKEKNGVPALACSSCGKFVHI